MIPAEVWFHLEEDTRISPSPGRVQRRILPGGRRDFLLGLEIPSRARMLILRVAAASAEGQPEVTDSRGVVVRTSSLGTNDGRLEVELILRDQRHSDIFDLLVTDLVEAAEGPEDERTGLTRFLARLTDWQQLLRRLAPGGLSRESQQGLWGEMWTLRRVVEPVLGMPEAVASWQGPLGEDQDFQLGGFCIEVKTSTANRMDSLQIASERQLEVPPGVSIVLLGLSLDARVGYGETLPEMVRECRNVASSAGCIHLLDHRLEAAGYNDSDEGQYSEIGYSLRFLRAFRVGSGFPRIVSGELPPGVENVRYSLSLAACSPFELDTEPPGGILRGLI